MKETLREMVNGVHNTSACRQRQQEYEERFRKAPKHQDCKYKNRPLDIQRLVEKVSLDGKISTKKKTFYI